MTAKKKTSKKTTTTSSTKKTSTTKLQPGFSPRPKSLSLVQAAGESFAGSPSPSQGPSVNGPTVRVSKR